MKISDFLKKGFSYVLRHTPGSSMIPDKTYLSWLYRLHIGHKMDWESPTSFNQKIQWLKVNDRNPQHTIMVDKLRVKSLVANRIGLEYVIPTIGVWNSFDEIDFSTLPNRFVLKTTHGGGGLNVMVIKDKTKLDWNKAKEKFDKSMRADVWHVYREWPYKDVPHKIIAEEYIEDEHGELRDYKFFCMNGEPQFLFLATNRMGEGDTTFDFLDLDYNRIPALNGHPNMNTKPVAPPNFKQMVDIAKKLSKGETFVRVDLYNVRGKIYFGEYTFFHNSGLVPFVPNEWDLKFGEKINLPKR